MAASLMEAVFDYQQQQQAATLTSPVSLPAGRSNFNVIEKEIIQQLVYKYRDVLAFRKNDHNTVMNKKKCWSLIELEYNSRGLVTKRTAKQLRKCWENLKARTKKIAHNVVHQLDDEVSCTSVSRDHIQQPTQQHHRVLPPTDQRRNQTHPYPRTRSPARRAFHVFPVPVSRHEDEDDEDEDDDDIYSAGSEPETTITIIPDVEEVLKQEPPSPGPQIQYSPDTAEERVSTSEHGGYLDRTHPVIIHEAMSSTSLPVCDTSKIPAQMSLNNIPFDFCAVGGHHNNNGATLHNQSGGASGDSGAPSDLIRQQQEQYRLKMIVLRQRKLHEEQQHEAKMAEHSAAMAVYALQREYWSQMLQNVSGQS